MTNRAENVKQIKDWKKKKKKKERLLFSQKPKPSGQNL